MKHQILINKGESASLDLFNDSKTFFEYWNDTDNTFKKIAEHSPNKKRKIPIVFDNMIAEILSIQKLIH